MGLDYVMRLDKWIQKYQSCGKSAARRLIATGEVKIDEVVVRDSRLDVSPFHNVKVNGRLVHSLKAHYIMLHKPAGFVSATHDEENQTVIDLIDESFASGLHLAGRLDKESTGMLILSNNGNWTKLITEPEKAIPKTYLVATEKRISAETVQRFEKGIYFAYEDITTLPAELEILDVQVARVVLYEGKYHQIKRMFHTVGNRVTSLHREKIGHLLLDEALACGSYRSLTDTEIEGFRC